MHARLAQVTNSCSTPLALNNAPLEPILLQMARTAVSAATPAAMVRSSPVAVMAFQTLGAQFGLPVR